MKKVSSLSPALAAVLGRRAAEPLRENFIKETDVGVACPGTDFCDGQVCVFQEILGEEQAVLLEDRFESLARVPADVARQIVGIHVKGFRRGFQGAGGPVFLQVAEDRQQQIVPAVGGLALILPVNFRQFQKNQGKAVVQKVFGVDVALEIFAEELIYEQGEPSAALRVEQEKTVRVLLGIHGGDQISGQVAAPGKSLKEIQVQILPPYQKIDQDIILAAGRRGVGRVLTDQDTLMFSQ